MNRSDLIVTLLVLVLIRPLNLLGDPTPTLPDNELLKYYNSQLYFEENKGQFNSEISFQTFITDCQVRFLPQSISYAMVRELEDDEPHVENEKKYVNYQWMGERDPEHEALVWNMNWVNACTDKQWAGKMPFEGYVNYIQGNDPEKWVSKARRYRELWYEGIYENIDLRYYGNNDHQLKYDFIIQPGGDLSSILMKPEGVINYSMGNEGELILQTSWGSVEEAAPYAYQLINGREEEVEIVYVKHPNGDIGFSMEGFYDPTHPLILDPIVLNWSSFLHSSTSDDYVMAVKRNAQEEVYFTGYTKSLVFPITPGVFQNVFGGSIDAYIAKFDASGSTLLFATYLGGTDWELAYGMGLGPSDEIYITGFARSEDYPVSVGAVQPVYGGGLVEGFLTKLSADGTSLEYSTYVGGSDRDYIYDMEVDATGNAFITGFTVSADFPVTAGSFSNTIGINGDAFVAKYNANGTSQIYSTYFGGNNYEIANSIAINAAGEAFVTGNTGSNNLTTTAGVIQPSANYVSGLTQEDAFLFRLNASGSGLIYSTYLGGTNSDGGYGVTVNASNEAFITGQTFSADFPTSTGAFQNSSSPLLANGDMFVAKVNATATNLEYSTYLGGTDVDFAKSIVVNSWGEAFVLGSTRSPDFPTTSPSAGLSAMYDIFLTVLSSDGTSLVSSALYGGSYNDYPRASGSLYLKDYTVSIAVTTHSSDIQVAGASFQGTKTNGVSDAPWIASLDVDAVLPAQRIFMSATWEESFKHVRLAWEHSDKDISGPYKVERQIAQGSWETIGKVELNRNPSYPYIFLDETAADHPQSTIIYRIKYASHSGDIRYGRIQEVRIPTSHENSFRFFPNPVKDKLFISYYVPPETQFYFEVIDAMGKSVHKSSPQYGQSRGISMNEELDTSLWPSGIYYLQFPSSSGTSEIQKLVVTH